MKTVALLSFATVAVSNGLFAQDVREVRDRVRAGVTTEALERHAREIVRHPRPSGSPGENAAIDYIANTLEAAGVPVKVHEFLTYTSNPVSATVTVPSTGFSPDAITMSFSAPTPGLTARLVDVGALRDLPALEVGTGERLALPTDVQSRLPDLNGAIVLVNGLPRNQPVSVLSELGATGAVFVNPEERLNELIVTSTWGTPSLRNAHRLPRLPVAEVKKSAGDSLRALLAAGPVTVRLETTVDAGWKPLRLAVARVMPGGGTEEDESPYVLLGGHIDAWHHGATDEGASNAAMLEMALAFHAQRDRIRRGLVVAWWPGHSNARYGGSTWFADHFFEELRDRGVAYLNIDGVGQRGAARFGATSTVSLADLAGRTVRSRVGADVRPGRPGRNSDQSFNGIGLPLLQFNHTRLPEDGGYWWWHTPDDTFDKIDFDVLKTDTDLYVDALSELTAAERLPLDLVAQIDALTAIVRERQDTAGDRFDFGTVIERTTELRLLADRVSAAVAESSPSADTDRALVSALRPLHRVLYTPAGPYHPDPGVGLGMMPGLDPVRVLAATNASSDRHRFALASLVRERNRVLDAVDQTRRTLQLLEAALPLY